MTLRLLLPLMLAACGAEAGNSHAGRSAEANGSGTQASRPAGAPASGVNDVIGATPGPCGSTRATAFLGRTYRPEMDAELKRASGAAAIRRVRPTGEDAGGGPPVDRRLNVLLNDFGQIIMLDCG
jgi:hypothetical protein